MKKVQKAKEGKGAYKVVSIQKRDGTRTPFEKEKITSAIFRAMASVGVESEEKANAYADCVVEKIQETTKGKEAPTVEGVQDLVEQVLIEKGEVRVARAYITYREKRTEIRNEKKQVLEKETIDEVDKSFDVNALRVLKSRYLDKDEEGHLTESPKDLFRRVAIHAYLPSVLYDNAFWRKRQEKNIYPDEDGREKELAGKIKIGAFELNLYHIQGLKLAYDRLNHDGNMKHPWSRVVTMLQKENFSHHEKGIERFYNAMWQKKFLPNTPALANFGRSLGMGSACFVLGIGDSMENIMATLQSAAFIFKAGGGVGYNFSALRPEGDRVRSTSGTASGPISFMSLFDKMTEVIKQGGIRRGANMGILNSNHPDVEKFITAKEGNKALRNFNISILLMDDFWKYYEKNEDYPLINPRTKKVERAINARMLFDLIVYQAWESAEPGVIFADHVNEYNPFLKSLGPIVTTNPCITGDSLVATKNGLERIDALQTQAITIDRRAKVQAEKDCIKVGGEGNEEVVRVLTRWGRERALDTRGTIEGEVKAVFQTGVKEVYLLRTASGYEIKATSDHMFLTPVGWRELRALQKGDELFIQSGEGDWSANQNLPCNVQNTKIGKNGRLYSFNLPQAWSKELGRVLGWLVGDGWLSEKYHLASWVFSKEDSEAKEALEPIIEKYLNRKGIAREITRGVWQVRSASTHIVSFLRELGVRVLGEEKRVPESIFQAPKEAVVGFIEGLFSSDGTVGRGSKSRHYIRLNSSSRALLKDVQMLLLNFGIKSAIYDRSTKPKTFSYINKDGILVRHTTSGTNYELNISKESFATFARTFEFIQKRKNERMKEIAEHHEFYRDYFIEKVEEIAPRGKESVWDLTEETTHSFIANGFVIKNCGEVLLYPNESCNLGSVNIHAFVKRNGDRTARFDWEGLKEAVKIGVDFLDNVIEVNNFPLPAIEEMTRKTRKIGLGVMGVADALFALRIPYDSKEGMAFMERLMQFVNYWSKDESVELAKTRGAFPLYKDTFFTEGRIPFAGSKDKKSWDFDWKEITERIKKEGIRNSYTTVIAPTGSISMIAGTSSGIEPVFSLVYEKNVAVGSFYYIDPEFEIAMKEFGIYDEELLKTIVSHHGSLEGISYLPKQVKSVFRVAHDLTPESHVHALAIFQKWVDSSISKTINFSKHATVDDMKKAYLLAYKLGCKDVTVYRDSSIENQVLSAPGKKEEKSEKGEEKKPLPVGTKPTNCPKCSTKLVRGEGCLKCPSCGWGLCA